MQNRHRDRAIQESAMKAAATGPARLIHETMLFYHLERCHSLVEDLRVCDECGLCATCYRHHQNIRNERTVSVVDLVELSQSCD